MDIFVALPYDYHHIKYVYSMLVKSLQVKSQELFEEWVSKLRHHRVFRQNEIATYPHERHLFYPHSSPSLNESMKKVGCY